MWDWKLSKVSVVRKIKGKRRKTYKSTLTSPPIKGGRILWLRANRETLQRLLQVLNDLPEVWIAINVPGDWRVSEGVIEFDPRDEDLAEKIANLYDGIITGYTFIGEVKTKNEDLHLERKAEGPLHLVLPKTTDVVEVACPFCGTVTKYEVLDLNMMVRPNKCPSCGACVSGEIKDSVGETIIMGLDLFPGQNGYRNGWIKREGDHYKGDEKIIAKNTETGEEAIAVQIDPHKDFESLELYLIFWKIREECENGGEGEIS